MLASLYVVVHEDDFSTCERDGCLPSLRVNPGKDYISLRVSPEAAMERYRQTFGATVPTEKLLVLCLNFTEKGFAHFASDICDQAHFFCPRLSKKVVNDSCTDWGVWHFVGDLPMIQNEFVQVSWQRVFDVTVTEMLQITWHR